MKIFAIGLALALSFFTHATPANAATGAKPKLTPEQKAKCERVQDMRLRAHRLPGTRKTPAFCRTS